MKKPAIWDKLRDSIARASFSLRKNSPQIMVIAGVVGVVGSAVMACRATMKVGDILEESKVQVDAVHEKMEGILMTQEDAGKELAGIHVRTWLRFAVLYLPSVALGSASIAGILASSNMLRKRNMALAAAYATIDRGFKEYRARVAERFGDEAEHEVRFGVRAKEIEVQVLDENGKETTEMRTVKTAEIDEYNDYARIFDERCKGYDQNLDYTRAFLSMQQALANDTLRANKFVTLNEVYEMLGYHKTKAGQVVGWVYDKENPLGDNRIDFGVHILYDTEGENCDSLIMLDFNVDGYILDKAVEMKLLEK